MAKLYFKYGAMGSSKSAQALITQFNYEELGMTVWLIKPSVDDRDGADIVKSRVGLERHATVIYPTDDIRARYDAAGKFDVVIADEAQFFTPAQIDSLRDMVDELDLPVLCFGLRTDFLTHTFPGSQRLLELADLHNGDKDRLRLRQQGHRQRPRDAGRTHNNRRRAGVPRRQRQLRRHVPQVLAQKDKRAGSRGEIINRPSDMDGRFIIWVRIMGGV